MKKSLKIYILSISLCFLSLPVMPVMAQVDYDLLAPLPLSTPQDRAASTTTPNDYIPGIIRLTIAVAGALAVIQIIIGGLKYMSTDSADSKGGAKKTINNAIGGFILIISAYLILYTINPNLLTINLDVAPVNEGVSFNNNGGREGTADNTTGDDIIRGSNNGDEFEVDSTLRNRLASAGITINKSACTNVGQTNCTAVEGLRISIVSTLENMAEDCGCSITITGGTEYWLHGNRTTDLANAGTRHIPNGTALDLSLHNSAFNAYVRETGKLVSDRAGCDATGSERYTIGNTTFVNEGSTKSGNTFTTPSDAPHWHVCFN